MCAVFVRALMEKGAAPHQEDYFIACDADPKRSKCWLKQSPCLLSSKSKGGWITSRGRRMKLEEQMRFQGIDPTIFTRDVSEPELGKQIGNAMSQCVIERLLNKLIPAAGFINKMPDDRWESGEAMKALEESRDKTFRSTDQSEVSYCPGSPSELGEIHFWNRNQVFRYYRLPNKWAWLKWEDVTRVIHKCGGSGDILFDEQVTDKNRDDQLFWEQPCAVAGGMFSIFLYNKPKDDGYWKKVRQLTKRK